MTGRLTPVRGRENGSRGLARLGFNFRPTPRLERTSVRHLSNGALIVAHLRACGSGRSVTTTCDGRQIIEH